MMKTKTLALASATFSPLCLHGQLVPGGDFEIYKPGSNYTIAATWGSGNSFARGVGDGIELQNGTVTYADGSDPGVSGDGIPDFDLPGWAALQSGNDTLANGVDGSTGMNLFAAWGGDGRIKSAEPLGVLQSGSTYTITTMVGGPAGGPIGGPLAFHLIVDDNEITPDGTRLVPSEFQDVVAPDGSFQMISRTYDATSIADHIGKPFKISLGVEDANDFANRVIFDNVSLFVEGAPAADIPLTITPNEANPGNYDFSAGARDGFLYDLVSSTDLSTDPATWAVWEGQGDLAGTSPSITISNVPGGTDEKRFFALIEKEAP